MSTSPETHKCTRMQTVRSRTLAMHGNMHANMHPHTHTHRHASTHTRLHTHAQTQAHTHTNTHTHTHTHKPMGAHKRVCKECVLRGKAYHFPLSLSLCGGVAGPDNVDRQRFRLDVRPLEQSRQSSLCSLRSGGSPGWALRCHRGGIL